MGWGSGAYELGKSDMPIISDHQCSHTARWCRLKQGKRAAEASVAVGVKGAKKGCGGSDGQRW